MTATPEVSVVVPSHNRHLRLRWLLNALEEQTLAPHRWEVVVCHTYPPELARLVIEEHPLHAAGRLRHLPVSGRSPGPAVQRNLGWRAARAPLIAFTDDDCRPQADWLEALMVRAGDEAVVVQGATRPDPFEAEILRAPHVRTILVEPVNRYTQTCNILYPRALLERLSGFDERAITGEDVDLSLRAREAGARLTAAPNAVVFHAVESHWLPGILRQNLKWRHLAYLVARHPELREGMPLRMFWDDEHLLSALALTGVAAAAASHGRAGAILAAPWLLRNADRRGSGKRARILCTAEAPGQALRQWAELAGLAYGSVRYRTVVL